MSTKQKPIVKYIAEVRNAQEVTLYGAADLEYWAGKLQPDGLVPRDVNGSAEILISAVASRWMGVKFSELIVAVSVVNEPDRDVQGLYLLCAYNTSRAFAFIERTFFRTPYLYRSLSVQCGLSPRFRLQGKNGPLVFAQRAETRFVAPATETVWEGAIYLPPLSSQDQKPGNVFYARLGGLTEICPYVGSEDTLTIERSVSDPISGWLLDSEFVGHEWRIRDNASHARSRTFLRT